MPTTLTGLLMFVVLLLPGFVYLVGKERVGAERRTSPFRETVSIVAASVTTELVVTVVTWPLWSWSLDMDAFITAPGRYWREHPGLVSAWMLGLLAASVVLAYTATRPAVRKWLRDTRWTRQLVGDYPHPSSVSAWWLLFETYRGGRDRHVGVMLDDGSYMHGKLISFNQSAEDSPDRDLILAAPVTYRASDMATVSELDCAAVCVAARRIVAMTVAYTDPDS